MRPIVHVDPDSGRVHRVKVLRSTSCGKQGYTGRKEAKARAKWVQRTMGEPVQAYRCSDCHCWHIGHPIGLRSRRR